MHIHVLPDGSFATLRSLLDLIIDYPETWIQPPDMIHKAVGKSSRTLRFASRESGL
jgi:hypothetical protein